MTEAVDAAKYGYGSVQVKDVDGTVKYTAPALEELIRWRLWNRTSAGVMAELGSHQLDAASIFIGAMHARASKDPNSHPLVHPISVAAVGNRNIYDWDREIEDHMSCIIEFPGPEYNAKDALGRLKTITVAYTALSGNSFGGYGETVLGNKGTIVLEEEQKYMLYSTDAAPESTVASTKIAVTKGSGKDKDSAVLDTQASGGPQAAAVGAAALGQISRGYKEELEHWAWCIRNRDPKNQPRCRPEVALKDAVIALTTNLAVQRRERIEFNDEWFDIKKDATPDGSKINLSQYKAPV